MEYTPDSNKDPKKPKIIDEHIEASKQDAKEAIEKNEFFIKQSFDMLKNNIEFLKQTEKRIKEMIDFTKKSQEMDEFYKKHGQESSFSDNAYTVGDVEKELATIEVVKLQIKEIHDAITDAQLDTLKEQEELKRLGVLEQEFKEIATRINLDQHN